MSNGADKRSRNKPPSPRLHRITQMWTEDEWRQFVAFAKVYGNGSKQLRLLELLRSMQEGYRPDLERAEFPGDSMAVTRFKAIRYSFRTGRRLDLIRNYQLMEDHGHVQLALQKCCYEEAAEFLGEAMAMALAREEFAMVELFLAQERALITATMQGDERTNAMRANANATRQNAAHIALASEIVETRAEHLEAARSTYIATGIRDTAAVKAYFDCNIAKRDLAAFPASLQIERLALDELAYFIVNDLDAALKVADSIRSILIGNRALFERLRVKYSKTLMNLIGYNADLGRKQEANQILSHFKSLDPMAEGHRDYFLADYLYSLLGLSVDTGDFQLGLQGLEIWEANRAYLVAGPRSNAFLITLLQISSYQLAIGDYISARRDFNVLAGFAKPFARPQYQAIMMLVHLILLFEEQDEVGLASHGRNYRRKLEKMDGIVKPALLVVSVLQRQQDLRPKAICPAIAALIPQIKAYAVNPAFEFALFYENLLAWMETKANP